jgi:protein TonB
MSIALVPRAIRHTLVISAIELPPFMTYLEVPEPTLVVKPDAFRAGEYEREVQQKPDIFIPTFDDRPRLPVMGSSAHPASTGAGPRVPPIDVQAPELRTGDRRVQSLIDSCYPAAARRLSEEGRVVARVVIGADGRAVSWAVDQGSGFPRLDAAMDCVLRRLEFVAGRRDGRAVEAMARLPIVFRLH